MNHRATRAASALGVVVCLLLTGACTAGVRGAAQSTGSTGSSGSPATPRVEVTVTLAARDGGAPSAADLKDTASTLLRRAKRFPGARAEVQAKNQILLTAPGEDPDALAAIAVVGRLDLRPVNTSAPGVKSGSLPAGGDQTVPTQPSGSTPATWKTWEETAAAELNTGKGPSCTEVRRYRGKDVPTKPLLACNSEGDTGYLLEPALFSASDIQDAVAAQAPEGWAIDVTMTSKAAATWSGYTTEHVGSAVGFTMDGTVLSAPIINAPISGATTRISGAFTRASAQGLADAIASGSLPLLVTDATTRVVR